MDKNKKIELRKLRPRIERARTTFGLICIATATCLIIPVLGVDILAQHKQIEKQVDTLQKQIFIYGDEGTAKGSVVFTSQK
jgi:hypothetical protein